jgi:hypothetical protein
LIFLPFALNAFKKEAQMEEVWLSPEGYEGLYLVSNLGRVLGGKRKKLLNPTCEKLTGYYSICLSRDGLVKKFRLNILVLSTFCGPKPFDNAHAAHNNGDKSDNRLINLRWASPKENQDDIDRHGRRCKGEDVFGAVLNENKIKKIRDRIKNGEMNRPIAEDFGVSISTIHLIRHNKIWRHI